MTSDYLLLRALSAIGKIQNDEVLAPAILRFLEYHSKLSDFIRILVRERLEITPNEANLFREDSSDTWLLKTIAKEHGTSFIKYLLKPVVTAVVDMPLAFEINPQKIINKFFLDANRLNCRKMVNELLENLENSIPQFPMYKKNNFFLLVF